jgi:hypothetical protein
MISSLIRCRVFDMVITKALDQVVSSCLRGNNIFIPSYGDMYRQVIIKYNSRTMYLNRVVIGHVIDNVSIEYFYDSGYVKDACGNIIINQDDAGNIVIFTLGITQTIYQ